MNTQKDTFPKILKITAVVVAVLICIITIMFLSLRPEDLEISNVDLVTINDGVYIGSADNGLVSATVSVEISSGVVQSISIVKHDNLLGKPAEKIIENVIEQQSLDVDAITSATI